MLVWEFSLETNSKNIITKNTCSPFYYIRCNKYSRVVIMYFPIGRSIDCIVSKYSNIISIKNTFKNVNMKTSWSEKEQKALLSLSNPDCVEHHTTAFSSSTIRLLLPILSSNSNAVDIFCVFLEALPQHQLKRYVCSSSSREVETLFVKLKTRLFVSKDN